MGEHLFADRDFVDADPDRAHRPGIAERAHRLVPAVQELAEMMGVRLAVGHPAEIVRIEYVDPVAAQARTARIIAAHHGVVAVIERAPARFGRDHALARARAHSTLGRPEWREKEWTSG